MSESQRAAGRDIRREGPMKLHIRHFWIALIVAALLLLIATIAVGLKAA